MRSMRILGTVICFCLFLLNLVVGVAIAIAGYVILSPFMLLNHVLHKRELKRLDEEDEKYGDTEDYVSSEEFGARADVTGGILRILPLMALGSAMECWDEMMSQCRSI